MEYDNNIQQIRQLMDSYLDGETTLEQESRLKEYYNSGQPIPEDLLYAKAMFACFDIAAQGRMENPYEVPVTGVKSKNKLLIRRVAYTLAAASIALAVYFANTSIRTTTDIHPVIYCYVNGQAVTDYQTAIDETNIALEAVAEIFARPAAGLEPIGKIEELLEQLDKLQVLEKFFTLD